MDREQKQTAVKEIGEQLEASSAVFAVDYRGISVPQAAELRGRLREADATFNVVKNRLVKRVTAETGTETLDEHLVGPTALTYVKGDAVIAAKAISSFIKENQTISFKGGIMDGDPLDPEKFNSIARLPGLEVLHGQLVGLAASPLTGLVSGLNGLIQGLATQLGQIAEQGLVSGEVPAAESEDAPAEEAEAPAEQAGDAEAGDAEAPAGEAAAGDAEAPAGEAEAGDAEAPAEEAAAGDAEAPAGEEVPAEQAAAAADDASQSPDEGDAEKTDESDTESKED